MQAKSSAYFTALTAGSVEWRYGLDILAADEATPLEDSSAYDQNAADRLLSSSGSIELDTSAKTHRTFKLSLRSNDMRYLPGPLGFALGGSGTAKGLIWYNVRYRPWIDLLTGFDATGAKVYDRTYLGMFVLVQPQIDVDARQAIVTLTLGDKSLLLQKPFLLTASNLPTFSKGGHTVSGYAKGTSFDSAMSDLANRAGIPASKRFFEPSAINLPADWTIIEGDEPWTHLQNMAGSIAHILYFDHAGNLIRRDHPLYLQTPSTYTFTPGPLCITAKVVRQIDLSNTYNHVVAIGASNQGAIVRGEAQVNDPSSPYHENQIGKRLVYVGKDGKLDDLTPDPGISTAGQALKRAQVILAQHIGRQENLELDGRNMPPLEPYDRFTVNVPQAGLNTDFLATKVTWNLAHDGMKINASRWFPVGS